MIWISTFFCWFFLMAYSFKNWLEQDKYFRTLTVLRLASALVFVFVYQNIYIGDLTDYLKLTSFWEKKPMLEVLFTDKHVPSQISNEYRRIFFAKFFHFIHAINFSCLYLDAIIVALIGNIFLYKTYKIINYRLEYKNITFCIALGFPSILFWSSGICKEALAFPALLFLSAYFWSKFSYTERKFDKWKIKNWKVKSISILFFSILILLELRFFYLVFVLFVAYLFVLFKYYNRPWFWIASVFLCVCYFFGQYLLMPQLQFEVILELAKLNYYQMIDLSNGSNFIQLNFQENSNWNIYLAFLESYKGVFFVSTTNLFVSFISLENSLVFLLLFFGLLYFKKVEMRKEFYVMLLFTLVCAGFFCLVSPNYGCLSRYRIVFWFFWVWFGLEQLKSLPKIRRLLEKD